MRFARNNPQDDIARLFDRAVRGGRTDWQSLAAICPQTVGSRVPCVIGAWQGQVAAHWQEASRRVGSLCVGDAPAHGVFTRLSGGSEIARRAHPCARCSGQAADRRCGAVEGIWGRATLCWRLISGGVGHLLTRPPLGFLTLAPSEKHRRVNAGLLARCGRFPS